MSDANESKATKGGDMDWRTAENAPACYQLEFEQVVRIRWKDASGRRCTTWRTAQELGDAITAARAGAPGVNSHAALVEALEQIAAGDTMYDLSKEYRDIARAALAAAKALS